MAKKSMGPVQVIGTATCKAMGINPNDVTSIHLHMIVGEPMRADVRFIVEADLELGEQFKQFEIVEVASGDD